MKTNALPARLIVMGVAGCGKTTIGSLLARRLGSRFLDGDDHHPAANVVKMSSGVPLTDDDRWPWLDRLAAVVEDAVQSAERAVLACSALRRVHRERLTMACAEPPLFIYLSGGRDLIRARMAARRDHFMPVHLLDSQFAALEAPGPDENAISVDIEVSAEDVVERIIGKFVVA